MLAAIGSASMLAILLIGLQLAGAVIARHRAEAAADVAALAGAAAVLLDVGAACSRAGEIAAANGARLTGCAIQEMDLTVTVAVPVSLGILGGAASGRARAGPVRPPIE